MQECRNVRFEVRKHRNTRIKIRGNVARGVSSDGFSFLYFDVFELRILHSCIFAFIGQHFRQSTPRNPEKHPQSEPPQSQARNSYEAPSLDPEADQTVPVWSL